MRRTYRITLSCLIHGVILETKLSSRNSEIQRCGKSLDIRRLSIAVWKLFEMDLNGFGLIRK